MKKRRQKHYKKRTKRAKKKDKTPIRLQSYLCKVCGDKIPFARMCPCIWFSKETMEVMSKILNNINIS